MLNLLTQKEDKEAEAGGEVAEEAGASSRRDPRYRGRK